jgi:hypothetical protein
MPFVKRRCGVTDNPAKMKIGMHFTSVSKRNGDIVSFNAAKITAANC